MIRMIPHAGSPLDQVSHRRGGPQRCVIYPALAGLAQRVFDLLQLLGIQSGACGPRGPPSSGRPCLGSCQTAYQRPTDWALTSHVPGDLDLTPALIGRVWPHAFVAVEVG